jgi:two-component system NtrC family sensor kinase
LEESQEGVIRVKEIVQDLKDFSHLGSEDDWQWTNLHAGLNSTLNIVNNEIKYKAKVVKEFGDLPEVKCLPHQLNQVFMNLLVNAAHAIEQEGTITLRTGTDNDRVWIEISDTGHGIATEHQHKIFDPFFTTKPVGKGTGLGLSISYSIIKKHQGDIHLCSQPGQGTTFRIVLPIAGPLVENAQNTSHSD